MIAPSVSRTQGRFPLGKTRFGSGMKTNELNPGYEEHPRAAKALGRRRIKVKERRL